MDEERIRRRRSIVPAVLASVVPQSVFAVLLVAHPEDLRRFGSAVETPNGWLYGALGLASGAALLVLRRRAPGPAVLVTGCFAVAAFALAPMVPFALLPLVVAIVIAMTHGARWWAVGAVTAALFLPLFQLFVVDSAAVARRSVGIMLILLVALGLGAVARSRMVRSEEEVRRRADRQRIAVEQERVRIARELHDVLAHSLSSISVQAGVGLHLSADRPDAAVEALETIRTASRDALDEVRGVLGLLRGDDEAPRAPEPDLDGLGPLVADVRRTGARVELEDSLTPRPPRPVQLALFRIAQESLTNARRHASGASVSIVLRSEAGDAVVRIRDRMAGRSPQTPIPGNGLTGMRERAEALHGRLDVVVHEDGLEVVARLPVPATVGSA